MRKIKPYSRNPIIIHKVYWLFIACFLSISSTSYADIVGSWNVKGALNVTFSIPGHKPVKTVSTIDEIMVINADKTFTRGELTGKWTHKRNGLTDAKHDVNPYISHLTSFWTTAGLTVSDIRIIQNSMLIREVSNGFTAKTILQYKMNVTENGHVRKATVKIEGDLLSQSEKTENAALSELFASLNPGMGGFTSSSLFLSNGSFTTYTYNLTVVQTGTRNIIRKHNPIPDRYIVILGDASTKPADINDNVNVVAEAERLSAKYDIKVAYQWTRPFKAFVMQINENVAISMLNEPLVFAIEEYSNDTVKYIVTLKKESEKSIDVKAISGSLAQEYGFQVDQELPSVNGFMTTLHPGNEYTISSDPRVEAVVRELQ